MEIRYLMIFRLSGPFDKFEADIGNIYLTVFCRKLRSETNRDLIGLLSATPTLLQLFCLFGDYHCVMGNLGKPLNFPLVCTRKGAVEPLRSNWYCAARFTCWEGNFYTIVSEHSV